MIRVVRTRNGDDVICDIQEITQEGEKKILGYQLEHPYYACLLYTSPSPRDRQKSRMPSSA